PRSFPLGLAEDLRRLRVRVRPAADPFWPERELKQAWEVRAVEASLRAAEAGLLAGIDALRACGLGRDGYLRRDRRRFTAEDLRAVINTRIMADGGVPSHTICAAGDRAVDPHEEGHGPGLQIHEPPSISKRGSALRAGHVVTVEPGLYYLGLGGVRIEDVAVVTARGSRNLTRAPDVLEI